MKVLTKGIDVSAHQGKIDWQKVKSAGIDYAILRCGFGSDIASQDDSQFARNMAECERVGMPFGVYLYSYANSVEKAKSEAQHVLRLIKGHKLQYPVYYDLEDSGTTGKCSKALILEMAKAFVNTLESKGYWVGIYANTYWNNAYLTDSWYDSKARWVAQYNSKCTYKGEYGMWQYSSKGKVNGIQGNVDMNYCYVDYPTLMKTEHKNGYVATSKPKEEAKPKLKSIDVIAREVLAGKWGNGTDRKTKLKKAGYDYNKVQARVNELLKIKNIKKGDAIVLKKEPLYANASTKKVSRYISGTYYIYDGVEINGRYRITNNRKRVGKKPAALNVTGYINV
jgi:GH25 family lysozyme M1 (1,4-beta-N-acetylmuramidase)